MNLKQIIFTGAKEVVYKNVKIDALKDNEILVKTHYSTISSGTEKANLLGDPNNAGVANGIPYFPRVLGYSSAGVVVDKGKNVSKVNLGDRVVVYWGKHSNYNIVSEDNVVIIKDDSISLKEAALSFIATFSLAALRKTNIEIGESILIMGLGILGQFAVPLAKAAGAIPIVAADPIKSRRELALSSGADYAFDPLDPDFACITKELTHGGFNTAIEVTGVGAGLNETLDCMAKQGRISLLGCTRNSDFTVDYYNKIHVPGIHLIGAHTFVRPSHESYPHYFTHEDDIKTVLKLCSSKRLSLESLISETYHPCDCIDVYDRLLNDPDFPVIVQFDWTEE